MKRTVFLIITCLAIACLTIGIIVMSYCNSTNYTVRNFYSENEECLKESAEILKSKRNQLIRKKMVSKNETIICSEVGILYDESCLLDFNKCFSSDEGATIEYLLNNGVELIYIGNGKTSYCLGGGISLSQEIFIYNLDPHSGMINVDDTKLGDGWFYTG